MKTSCLKQWFAIFAIVSGSSAPVAHAQAQHADRSSPHAPPAAREGFQVAARPNVALPLGSAFEGGDLDLLATPLVGVDADVGVKATPNLFLGGRPSIGLGGVGDARDAICQELDSTCIVSRVGIGAEAQYQFRPSDRVNPWIGYGFGLDILSVTRENVLRKVSNSLFGFDFARLSGGVDWRINRIFGVGLFADFAMGIYFREVRTEEVEGRRSDSTSESIEHTAMHYWLSFGPRFVFFP